jgi:hypothetical protein
MVTLHRDARKAEDLTGDVMTFPTRQGEIVAVVPRGSMPPTANIP